MHRLIIPTELIFLLLIWQISAQDNRCYLPSGSSSETFSVSEDLSVDSQIGILNVSGCVGDEGDIELQMEDESTVALKPLTKILILKRKLDKESQEGKEGIKIEVICVRKESDDPSITIPIYIIVMDANDNTPEFVNAPYFVNISEATLVGTTVMHTILAIDKDQKGPFSTVEYSIEPGPYSDLLTFRNKLDGVISLSQPLDYEAVKSFNVTIIAQDEGYSPRSSETSLTVTVLDADDQNPQFSVPRYKARLPEDPQPGTKIVTFPTAISAIDPDEGIESDIEYTFLSSNGESAYFNINNKTGEITIKQRLPLNFKLPVTLVVRATQTDNPDRQTLATIQISNGEILTNELRFLHAVYDAKVLEHSPPGIVIKTLLTTRVLDTNVKLQIVEKQNHFTVTNLGEVIVKESPDYEVKNHFDFHVTMTDGQQSDITVINITVLDINDHSPEFSHPYYYFEVFDPHIRTGTVLGKVEASDGDVQDHITFSVDGFFASAFSITSMGELQIIDVDLINSSSCYLMVIATDDGSPSRQSAVPITIQFPADFLREKRQEKDDSYVLMISFGILLGILIVIIIILLIYVIKYKSTNEQLVDVTTVMANKVVQTKNSKETETEFNKSTLNPIKEEESRSETPSTIPMNSWKKYPIIEETRRELYHTSPYKVIMNGFIKSSNCQNIHWPNGSIPQRVKTIGWEGDSSTKTDIEATEDAESGEKSLKFEKFEHSNDEKT